MLFQEFEEATFEKQILTLKNAHTAPPSERHRDALVLLYKLNERFKDVWETAEQELELCIRMSSDGDKYDKWEYLFADSRRVPLFKEWFDMDPELTSVLPWFDDLHDWKNMSSERYLQGARHLVGIQTLYPKMSDSCASQMLQDWSHWQTLVTDPEGRAFWSSCMWKCVVGETGEFPPRLPCASRRASFLAQGDSSQTAEDKRFEYSTRMAS
jgi:hypothetical protein